MNVRASLAAAVLALWPCVAFPQGFAGLGNDAEGFLLPDPETRFVFPDDHGPHAGFRIEWWYLTANLTGDDGREYGVQWTLFRNALQPTTGAGWSSGEAWMGHAAVTTPDAHFNAERFARGGIGQAGVQASPFDAWIDEWQMAGPSLSDINVSAQGTDFAYELSLKTQKPFAPQGQNGYAVKSTENLASHYYSQPFYNVTGTLILPSGTVSVTGQGWLDREWSSQPLTATQTGWDWVSLHLHNGEKLMGYRLRDDALPPYVVGTWIAADGKPMPYTDGVLTMNPKKTTAVNGREVPTSWEITLPPHGLEITIEALNPQSWMDTTVSYWEGPVRVQGSHTGRGYLEMTGYE